MKQLKQPSLTPDITLQQAKGNKVAEKEEKPMTPICIFEDALALSGELVALKSTLGRRENTASHSQLQHVIAAGTGAGAALDLAANQPERVATLTLLSPTAANLGSSGPLTTVLAFLKEGDPYAAARTWFDWRHGKGAFARQPLDQQHAAARTVSATATGAMAQRARPLDPFDLAGIVAPTLIVLDPVSPAGLLDWVPFHRIERFSSLQPHVTEAEQVHPLVAEFLASGETGWQDTTGPVDLAA